MLKNLVSKNFVYGFLSRKIQFASCLKNIEKPNPKTVEENVPPEHGINYIFREVRNESIIKEFCFGLFSPKLLKMPSADTPDDALHKLIDKLAATDFAVYDGGREQLIQMGIFGACIPKAYGGLGLTSTQYSYLLQSEKLINWTPALIAHQTLCAQAIIQYGTEEQKTKYLPKLASGELLGAFCLNEKSSGNDMFSMESEAVLSTLEDCYVLRGTKNWIINGHSADLFIVFTLTQDSKHEGGRRHITAFIVEKQAAGVTVGKSYELDWLHNCEVSDVTFKDVIVPVENVLYEDNGGYKIANYIQNNARFIMAASMGGIIRYLVNDLMTKDKCGLIPHDTYIRYLLDECHSLLYSVESSLYFTTRFSDQYVIPEIELESATVKVFSTESALRVVDYYHKILHLINQPVCDKFRDFSKKVKGLQNFMGSNYFTKLYIGGTMMDLSQLSFAEIRSKLRAPTDNYPWLNDQLKNARNVIKWAEPIGDSKYSDAVKFNVFRKDIEYVFRHLQASRLMLARAIRRYKDTTLEYQKIMTSMSDLGEMIYVLSCCVARANTTLGDYEVNCTKNLIGKAKLIINQSYKSLESSAIQSSSSLLATLSEDVRIFNGYPSLDVLEMRRELGREAQKANIFDDFDMSDQAKNN